MKRRDATMLLAGLAGLGIAGCASETPKPAIEVPAGPVVPIEVQDYVGLDKPLPVALAPGKAVEVIEFFWYECPHCNAFEPLLEAWLQRLPADVQFRRVPVGFTPRHVATQRLFYALQELGELERLHARVFDAIHRRSRRLSSDEAQLRFVVAEGVDGAKFREALGSPRVAAQVRAATRLADAYEVDSVPTLGIHGRFATSTAMTSSRPRTLAVADALIERCREAR